MRPYVRRAQRLPPFVPRVALPRTRAGIRVLNSVLWAASRPQVGRVGGRLWSPPANDFDLPDYSPMTAQ